MPQVARFTRGGAGHQRDLGRKRHAHGDCPVRRDESSQTSSRTSANYQKAGCATNRSDKADRLIINEAYCRAFARAAHLPFCH